MYTSYTYAIRYCHYSRVSHFLLMLNLTIACAIWWSHASRIRNRMFLPKRELLAHILGQRREQLMIFVTGSSNVPWLISSCANSPSGLRFVGWAEVDALFTFHHRSMVILRLHAVLFALAHAWFHRLLHQFRRRIFSILSLHARDCIVSSISPVQ